MTLDATTFDQLRSAVGDFVKRRLVPLEATVAETNSIPEDVKSDLREMGLFGLSIPQEYGGLGLNMEEEVQIAFELGYTSPAFRSLIGTNNGIGSQGLIIDGTKEQKEKYLPRLASGELISSFALTEPEAGSDAASLRTRARRDGNSYILNGTKRFITNAPHAGLFTLFARKDDSPDGNNSITA